MESSDGGSSSNTGLNFDSDSGFDVIDSKLSNLLRERCGVESEGRSVSSSAQRTVEEAIWTLFEIGDGTAVMCSFKSIWRIKCNRLLLGIDKVRVRKGRRRLIRLEHCFLLNMTLALVLSLPLLRL